MRVLPPRRWATAARQEHAESMIESLDPGECSCLWWAVFHGRVLDDADPIPVSDLCDEHAHLIEEDQS